MTRICLVGFFVFAIQAQVMAGLPQANLPQLGFDPALSKQIDDLLTHAVDEKKIPGAVVVVGRHGQIGFAKAFGQRAILPEPEAMTRDTVFDLASLTKPIATATSIMILVERGKLRLDQTLGEILPEFANHGKAGITIEQLLRHRAGFIPDNPIEDYANGSDAAWQKLAEIGLESPPGEKFRYSDVGYEILGKIVEPVSGKTLDRFTSDEIFTPLGMTSTRFLPPSITQIAPTEPADGKMLRGIVHDPRARVLNGVAGHAGLFGTADDLAVFAAMILQDNRLILKPETIRQMISPGTSPPNQKRGLGWDIDTPYSGPRGRSFGPLSFGHTGFTGTSLWIDPETDTFVILLTSRLHPDGKGKTPLALRSDLSTLVADALFDAATHTVRCGVDVLAREDFGRLKGKRVGLVTNHTGRLRDGRTTIDALFQAKDVKLVALFSPEHGIRGAVDREVADARDDVTGLPIFSLYGKTRKPSPENLTNLDVLVYDIQDVGARFYTYISTLGLVLEAAAESKLPVVVLDRPNPIGGIEVSGPVRDAEFASFIAFHALPVRHGMTVGEIAKMFVEERKIAADLTVVQCENWRRADLFDRSGLVWINPSPNMRSLTEAMLYPGVGLLEATNLATGRGTDTPFERVGAPWIDPAEWARSLNALNLNGLRFVPIRFMPTERQYAGKECGGVQILLTDWSRFDPIDLGLGLAITLRQIYPQNWEPTGLLKMIADRPTYDAIVGGKNIVEIKAVYAAELEAFRKVRERFLLYP